jgi:hypothetical protein
MLLCIERIKCFASCMYPPNETACDAAARLSVARNFRKTAAAMWHNVALLLPPSWVPPCCTVMCLAKF